MIADSEVNKQFKPKMVIKNPIRIENNRSNSKTRMDMLSPNRVKFGNDKGNVLSPHFNQSSKMRLKTELSIEID